MQAGLLKYYLFTDVPGSGKGWTLGILAISKQDARDYANLVHGSGKYIGIYTGNEETMICGAITEKAQEIVHENRMKYLGRDC